MGRFVGPELSKKIEAIMFEDWSSSPEEQFLRNELVRYVPQLIGKPDTFIKEFIEYQRAVRLDGVMPRVGTVIASFNPSFTDSVDLIEVSARKQGKVIYTRASIKENGYRMQLHLGIRGMSAFTRQFTSFDLRMFPELRKTFAKLPVMIGDLELVARNHKHLASFNVVQWRIPQSCWPKWNEKKLPDAAIEKYLQDEALFKNGQSYFNTELMLAFHGLYAIAHPSTWNSSREEQMESLVSFCGVPVDFMQMDSHLTALELFVREKGLNARVVEMFVPENHRDLVKYVKENEKKGLEGTCIVQSVWESGKQVVAGRSVKVKTYETIDTALLGLYLRKKSDGMTEGNVTGALLGLYDETLGVYVPATKVNLDPVGVQIKTPGQKSRLEKLRVDIISSVILKVDAGSEVCTLYDAFLLEGAQLLKYLFNDIEFKFDIEKVLEELPLRSDLLSLFQQYVENREVYLKRKAKHKTSAQKYIVQHIEFFQAIDKLDEKSQKRFFRYFSECSKIRKVSSKLLKPQVVVSTKFPTIIETQVFDLSWGVSPFPAGFHSWYFNSFRFNNVFAEVVRHDKSSTTDFTTIRSIVEKNTPNKKKLK